MSRIIRVEFVVLIVTLVWAAAVGPAAAQLITDCGQTVSAGVLSGDLDCTNFRGPGIAVAKNGTLDFAGHTLTGGMSVGVVCSGSCTITGNGGAVIGAGEDGIRLLGGHVAISDLEVSDNAGPWGIGGATAGRVRLVLSGVHVLRNGNFAVYARDVELSDSVVSEHELDGVQAGRNAVVTNSTIADNGRLGLYARKRATVTGSTFSGMGFDLPSEAIIARKITLQDVTVTGNHNGGVIGQRVTGAQSSVTNNALDASCDDAGCFDISSRKRPELSDVTCDSSARATREYEVTGENWGVCSLD